MYFLLFGEVFLLLHRIAVNFTHDVNFNDGRSSFSTFINEEANAINKLRIRNIQFASFKFVVLQIRFRPDFKMCAQRYSCHCRVESLNLNEKERDLHL